MLKRIEVFSGWNLGFVPDDDEPRVRDTDLAERLGFERPRDIRKLIDRIASDEKMSGFGICATVAQKTGGRGRPAQEYWLTEAQALLVAAKSETAKSAGILAEMIRVYMAWRRGQFQPIAAPVQLVANSATIKSNDQFCRECHSYIKRLAEVNEWSFQKAHGRLRSQFGIVSYLRIAIDNYRLVREWLVTSVMHPNMAPALVAAKAQQELFGRIP